MGARWVGTETGHLLAVIVFSDFTNAFKHNSPIFLAHFCVKTNNL